MQNMFLAEFISQFSGGSRGRVRGGPGGPGRSLFKTRLILKRNTLSDFLEFLDPHRRILKYCKIIKIVVIKQDLSKL